MALKCYYQGQLHSLWGLGHNENVGPCSHSRGKTHSFLPRRLPPPGTAIFICYRVSCSLRLGILAAAQAPEAPAGPAAPFCAGLSPTCAGEAGRQDCVPGLHCPIRLLSRNTNAKTPLLQFAEGDRSMQQPEHRWPWEDGMRPALLCVPCTPGGPFSSSHLSLSPLPPSMLLPPSNSDFGTIRVKLCSHTGHT